MSRRARALAFAAGALACAALAAAAASGYGRSIGDRYGELRGVLVASERIPAGVPLTARALERGFELRRIPERFVPPGALAGPEAALGLSPATVLEPGAYLIAAALEAPRRPRPEAPELAGGLVPVELAITGAGALLAAQEEEARLVDVVVVSEPGPGGGPGATRIAASGALLLELREAPAGAAGTGLPGDTATFVATVAVRRALVLDLIGAQNFAREIRLVPARKVVRG